MQASRLGIREPLLTTQRAFSSNSPPRRAFRPAPSTSSTLENFDKEFARLQIEEASSAPRTSATVRIALESLRTDSFHTTQYTAVDRSTSKSELVAAKEAKSYPLYSYTKFSSNAQVIYIRNEDEANEEVSKLNGPLGFDLEWRVIYMFRAPQRKAAVLQLCDEGRILIIQLSAMKTFPWKVKEIVESPTIIKMGANVAGDGKKLERDFGISPRGLLELSHLAHAVDPDRITSMRVVSLQTIVEMYTGYTLSKGPVRTSNWEDFLKPEQLAYAANDAHSALSAYNNLLKLAKERSLILQPIQTVNGRSITYPRKMSKGSSLRTITTVDSRESVSVPLPVASKKAGSLHSIGLASAVVVEDDATSSSSDPQTDSFPESSSNQQAATPMRPRFRRAYELWHYEGLSLNDLRSALRSPEKPLAESTVISYILSALTNDQTLSFSKQRLIELVRSDRFAWQMHKWWILRLPSG